MSKIADKEGMTTLGRRELILGAMFGGMAGVAWARRPAKQLNLLESDKLENLVPKSFGGWDFAAASGLIVPPEDQLSDALYSQLLTRVYSDGKNAPVMLLAAHSKEQTGVLQVHRPEVCYSASGFTLSEVTEGPILLGKRTLPALRLAATSEGFEEHIIYWTRVGRDLPVNWTEQRLSTARQNLSGLVPDAILVRVSMRSPDRAGSYALLEDFVRSMITAVPADRRSVFIA
jgi:EpsI family protein